MIYLVTGGAGSGKSAYAEQQMLRFPEENRIYIATMDPGNDPENAVRIRQHRERRASMAFQTIEQPLNLAYAEIPVHANILLEDVSNLVSNEMFTPNASGIHTVNAVLDGINHVLAHADNAVFVTNEIFSDGVAYNNGTRIFQTFLGAINQELARLADCVVEVVCGIPLTIKAPADGKAEEK